MDTVFGVIVVFLGVLTVGHFFDDLCALEMTIGHFFDSFLMIFCDFR